MSCLPSMDTVDFRILLELHRHPFASFEGIGRTVRITGTAVKARLERMEARGVVQGFYVAVAAPAFRRWRRIHGSGSTGWAAPSRSGSRSPAQCSCGDGGRRR